MSAARKGIRGFSLVETMIGLGVMALVITAGLVATGQTTLLSEKSTEQVLADFILRTEVENMRSASWSTISSYHNTVSNYGSGNSGDGYPSLTTFDKASLLDMGLTAEVTSAQLSSGGELGKIAFKVLVNWQDRSGRTHEEARVLIITEGGFSADT